jgi:hypothetical protein
LSSPDSNTNPSVLAKVTSPTSSSTVAADLADVQPSSPGIGVRASDVAPAKNSIDTSGATIAPTVSGSTQPSPLLSDTSSSFGAKSNTDGVVTNSKPAAPAAPVTPGVNQFRSLLLPLRLRLRPYAVLRTSYIDKFVEFVVGQISSGSDLISRALVASGDSIPISGMISLFEIFK